MMESTKKVMELWKEKAYPIGYHQQKCEQIKEKTKKIQLPKFTRDKINEYKEILEQSNKKYELNKKDLPEKFLTVIEMIYTLYSETNDKELEPYIQYLISYEYIIKKISDKKNKNTQKEINTLKPEIEQFTAKFSKIAEGDTETKTSIDIEDILKEEEEEEEND